MEGRTIAFDSQTADLHQAAGLQHDSLRDIFTEGTIGVSGASCLNGIDQARVMNGAARQIIVGQLIALSAPYGNTAPGTTGRRQADESPASLTNGKRGVRKSCL